MRVAIYCWAVRIAANVDRGTFEQRQMARDIRDKLLDSMIWSEVHEASRELEQEGI